MRTSEPATWGLNCSAPLSRFFSVNNFVLTRGRTHFEGSLASKLKRQQKKFSCSKTEKSSHFVNKSVLLSEHKHKIEMRCFRHALKEASAPHAQIVLVVRVGAEHQNRPRWDRPLNHRLYPFPVLCAWCGEIHFASRYNSPWRVPSIDDCAKTQKHPFTG
jgi:hypothetical protein